MQEHKYIFVTGGVCSSVGKGICCSSLGALFEMHNYVIDTVKIDPYLNIDAGTMSPYQHGEVFVLDDGTETDLDLGNYARFTSVKLSDKNSITTGKIYQRVIQKERQGLYLGQTVQVIPHIIDEIKESIYGRVKESGSAVTFVELGGTVGDIESIPFLEAVRQILVEQGPQNALCVHVTLLPFVNQNEVKTKPTQHSVRELMNQGIYPQALVCRSEMEPQEGTLDKLAQFTGVNKEGILISLNAKTIYAVPIIYHQKGFDTFLLKRLGLGLNLQKPLFERWEETITTINKAQKVVHIALVGKYTKHTDTYRSVLQALTHGCIPNKARLELHLVEGEDLNSRNQCEISFRAVDGLIIPGGFGKRSTTGLLLAINYARENKKPILGICLGMQLMVIEYARNVLGLKEAHSTEIDPKTPDPVVFLQKHQNLTQLGGTMRLGSSLITVEKESLLEKCYGKTSIKERHRHRFEVNQHYEAQLKEAKLNIVAKTADGLFVEALEWEGHPFGIGVQFHPEFLSSPMQPHPLFKSLIEASLSDKLENYRK